MDTYAWTVKSFCGCGVHQAPRPDDRNPGTRLVAAIFEVQFRPRALEQRLRDEEAEAEATGPIFARTAADIGLTDPLQNVLREALTVVLDHDRHLVAVVTDRHRDFAPGEIESILDQVAQAVEDAGIAQADRLCCAVSLFDEFELDAELAMGGQDLLDHGGQG